MAHREIEQQVKLVNTRGISRREFLTATGIAGVSVALAACVQAEPDSPAPGPVEEPVTLALWGWWEERMQIFQDAANDFREINPNVEIVVESVSVDLWPRVFAAVPAGTGPALLKMQTTNYFRLRDENLLVELEDDVFPDSELRQKFPAYDWDSYGRYCMPEGGQAAIFVYNQAMFEDAGLDPNAPPRTWDEFFEAGQLLTQRDGSGAISREGFAPDDWLPVLNPLYQLGGKLTEGTADNLQATYDTPEMERAYQFFVDAARTYEIWDPDFPYFTEAIGNRLAAMSIGEAWAHGVYLSDFPDTYQELGFAAPPTPTGDPDPYYGRQNAVLGLAVIQNRPPEETRAAQRFMEYLYIERLDSQYELAAIAGLVPAHAEILTWPDVNEDPFTSLCAGLLPLQYDAVEVSGTLNQLVTDTIDMMFLENRSIPEVLNFGQTELQNLIDGGEIKYLQ